MAKIRFIALTIITFILTLIPTLLQPGRVLNRILATVMCGILSFDSTACTVNLAKSSNKVLAISPPTIEKIITDNFENLLADRSREFDDDTPPSENNQESPYRDSRDSEFNYDTINDDSKTSDSSNYFDDYRKVYSFYINGIQNSGSDYQSTKPLVENLLNSAGAKPPLIYQNTYNFSSVENGRSLQEFAQQLDAINRQSGQSDKLPGNQEAWLLGLQAHIISFIGDLSEALVQQLFKMVGTSDGQNLVRSVVETIKKIDENNSEDAKEECEDKRKSKYVIVAHSQGNFFADQIASLLPKDIAGRTVVLGVSSFTDYKDARNNGVKVKLITREWDVSTFAIDWWNESFLNNNLIRKLIGLEAPLIKISNLPSLPNNANPLGLIANHSLSDYLGNPTKPEYTEAANQAFSLAVSTLANLINFDPGNYEKKEDCEPKPPKPCPSCGKGKGTSYGDPHLITYDGYRYSFQTVGEFILSKSVEGDFEVQTRQAPVPGQQLSLNIGAAMKIGSDRIAFYTKFFPDSNTNTILRINGKPTEIQSGSLTLPSGGRIDKQGQSNYLVEWPSGEQVAVRLISIGGSQYMNVTTYVVGSGFVGLLGDLNQDPSDDLKTRSGKVIPSRSTYGEVKNIVTKIVPIPGVIPLNTVENLFFDQVYKEFGNSWRVTPEESLFDYASGQTTANFTDKGFPNKYRTINMLSPQQIQQAEATCLQAGVEPELLDGCIFDVGFTGDAGFANAAANAFKVIEQFIPGGVPRPNLPVNIPGLPF
jgi:hypothetical protein